MFCYTHMTAGRIGGRLWRIYWLNTFIYWLNTFTKPFLNDWLNTPLDMEVAIPDGLIPLAAPEAWRADALSAKRISSTLKQNLHPISQQGPVLGCTFKLKRMLLPCGYVLSEPLMSHVATSWEHVCPAWANVGLGANLFRAEF